MKQENRGASKTERPVCYDRRPCFARKRFYFDTVCTVLTSTYEDGKCPFCKAKEGEKK